MHDRKVSLMLAMLTFLGGPLLSVADQPSPAGTIDRVVAIDVLLEPDATMVAKATAVNAQLRSDYPQGYALGENQAAHISLVHRYVREKDLPAIEAAVAKAADKAQPLQWKLTATKIENGVWAGLAITTIAVEHTPELDAFQAAIVEAVEPLAVTGGTAAAFCTNRELPRIDDDIVKYVENFVNKSSGKNYSPHVTVGVAREDFVKQLESQPFEAFSFRPAGVAIYQLGNFGTAQKKLWQWRTGKQPAQ